jgi:hypothetical protein
MGQQWKMSLSTRVVLMTCFLASRDYEVLVVSNYIDTVFINAPCDFWFKLRVLCNTQYGGTVIGNCSKQVPVANSITEAKYVAAFKRDKEDVESYSSFMNLVWFQDGFCQWDTTAGSCSITQSEVSRFDLWFTYIQSQVYTKYEFCESMKTRGYAKIHTELKSSDPLDIRLYHKRSIFTPVCHRCEVH